MRRALGKGSQSELCTPRELNAFHSVVRARLGAGRRHDGGKISTIVERELLHEPFIVLGNALPCALVGVQPGGVFLFRSHTTLKVWNTRMNLDLQPSKVPEVTAIFWFIKILATTFGETGGDVVSMSMDLGYALSSLIFIGIFVIAVIAQISAKSFHPLLYWLAVVATTTAGTTMADFADRSLGIGYPGGASLLSLLLIASLTFWYWSEGTISVSTVVSPRAETFYWVSILFSQTLGTALGDWMTDTNGLGYEGGALVFAAGLAVVSAAFFWTGISRTLLFWLAFILTRPLGATLGDWLDKPFEEGGLAFSRLYATVLLAAAILACIACLPQRAGSHARDLDATGS